MERYFHSSKPLVRGCQEDTKKARSTRFKPYATGKDERKATKSSLLELLPADETNPSSSTVTKLLLNTLKDEANPITHSDIYSRTEHIVSMASGHQVSEGRRNQRAYFDDRNRKLSEQKETSSEQRQVLRNVRVYIDGFLADTTDLEMKRTITLAGGQMLRTASGATHILTSQTLSGSKTHKHLTTKSRTPVHIVKPEWVFDSIKQGKRKSERDYSILKNNGTLDSFMKRKR